VTNWGILILAAALFFGLKDSLTSRQRYGGVCAVVVVALLYAAFKQHTY
jgi:hypothetical protein